MSDLLPFFPHVVRVKRRKPSARRSAPPSGAMLHVTGTGIYAAAKRAKRSPEEHVVEVYRTGPVFPDVLIGLSGTVYLFAEDQMAKTAHAAWRPWERLLYASDRWSPEAKTIPWAKDYHDGLVNVPASFYADWFDRWSEFDDPTQIVLHVTNGGEHPSPNDRFFGIELMSPLRGGPTSEQIVRAAEVFVALAHANEELDKELVTISHGVNRWELPSPWLLGHDDICPARRFCPVKGTRNKQGRGWDPGFSDEQWEELRAAIVEIARRTK